MEFLNNIKNPKNLFTMSSLSAKIYIVVKHNNTTLHIPYIGLYYYFRKFARRRNEGFKDIKT